ncbi:unnamed protein product [Meganyctiphanes norvegica]|uniref:C-type lectin domain-containing protein n=1 Tax=Meganyctiphanes norvegica TaxID=48144 RepID=A0AAV2RIE8_MEGNR
MLRRWSVLMVILMVQLSLQQEQEQEDLCGQTFLQHLAHIMESRFSAMDIRINELTSALMTRQDVHHQEMIQKFEELDRKFAYVTVGGSCLGGVIIGYQCLMFSNEKLTWEAAKEACVSNSRRLASLADPNAVLAYVIEKYGDEKFWAGGKDIGNEDNWEWLNGKPFDQFPWGDIQPDNHGGGQNCLVVNWRAGFDDAYCGDKNRYICEFDVTTNLDS